MIFINLVVSSILFLFADSSSSSQDSLTSVVSCDGSYLDNKNYKFVVHFNKKKNFYEVFWTDKINKTMTLVDSVAKTNISKIELNCFNAKQAQEHKQALQNSEIIHNFLNFKKGQGLICYFIDDTTSRCWTAKKNSKVLLSAGGWQT